MEKKMETTIMGSIRIIIGILLKSKVFLGGASGGLLG